MALLWLARVQLIKAILSMYHFGVNFVAEELKMSPVGTENGLAFSNYGAAFL